LHDLADGDADRDAAQTFINRLDLGRNPLGKTVRAFFGLAPVARIAAAAGCAFVAL